MSTDNNKVTDMREARTPEDPAELILNLDDIAVVMISLVKGAASARDMGMDDIVSRQLSIANYLLGVVEESYDNKAYLDTLNLFLYARDQQQI